MDDQSKEKNEKGVRPAAPPPPPKPSKGATAARKPIEEAIKSVINETSPHDSEPSADEITTRDSAPAFPPPPVPTATSSTATTGSNTAASRPHQPPPPMKIAKPSTASAPRSTSPLAKQNSDPLATEPNSPKGNTDTSHTNNHHKPYKPVPSTSPRSPMKKEDLSTSNPFDEDTTSSATTTKTAKPLSSLEQPAVKLTRPTGNVLKPSVSNTEESSTTGGDEERGSMMRNTLSATSNTSGKQAMILKGDPENEIYHLNTFSQGWLVIFLLLHFLQFLFLLITGFEQLTLGASILIVLLVIIVPMLTLYARYLVKKSKLGSFRNIQLRRGVCTPKDEADDVPDEAVYCIAWAAILEGITFAIYVAVLAGNSNHLHTSGLYNQDTILQILRFASITLLSLHRIVRPANRIDPLRTILEVITVTILYIFFVISCFMYSWK
jgi:hypothetical protein